MVSIKRLLIKSVIKFDKYCEKLGRSERYKKAYWFYMNQDKRFSTGLGKLFAPMQFISLLGNFTLVLIAIDKIFPLPSGVYKFSFVFLIFMVFFCWLLGRLIDLSNGLHWEAEWGNLRNPAMIEIRSAVKKKRGNNNGRRN